MVKLILGLEVAPTPNDAADALAVALCHSHATVPRAGLSRRAPVGKAETSWRHYRPARQ